MTAEAAALLRLSKRTLEKYRMRGIGGPSFAGLGRDAAIKRLKIPLDWDANGYVWAYANKLHDRGNRLYVWDDARLAQLGDKYQRCLKQQKEKSQRHKQ